MFAIIKTGGKQLKVAPGDEIYVEMLAGNEGDLVHFNEVLMIDDKFGNPFLSNASVTGVIMKQGKQKKIVVYHYKPKKTQHKKYGHRQPYTKVKIDEILLDASKSTKKQDSNKSEGSLKKVKPIITKEEVNPAKVLADKTSSPTAKELAGSALAQTHTFKEASEKEIIKAHEVLESSTAGEVEKDLAKQVLHEENVNEPVEKTTASPDKNKKSTSKKSVDSEK